MVRQKQGKSQIKYLKTKGKSRAGSRVRLGETEAFFQEISQRLSSYEIEFPIDTWGISCAKTLLPYFFATEPSPPFLKKQSNLYSIPFHVQHPGLETLEDIHKKINQIHCIISDNGTELFELDQQINVSNNIDSENNEDW